MRILHTYLQNTYMCMTIDNIGIVCRAARYYTNDV